MPTEAEMRAALQGFSDDELKQYGRLVNGVIDNYRYNIDTEDFYRDEVVEGIINNNERFLRELEKDFNAINKASKRAGSYDTAPEQKIAKDGVWDEETALRAVALNNYVLELGGDEIAIRNKYDNLADRARDSILPNAGSESLKVNSVATEQAFNGRIMRANSAASKLDNVGEKLSKFPQTDLTLLVKLNDALYGTSYAQQLKTPDEEASESKTETEAQVEAKQDTPETPPIETVTPEAAITDTLDETSGEATTDEAEMSDFASPWLVINLKNEFGITPATPDYNAATQTVVENFLKAQLLPLLKDENSEFNTLYLNGDNTLLVDGKKYEIDEEGLIYTIDPATGKRTEGETPTTLFDPDKPHPATKAILGSLIQYQEQHYIAALGVYKDNLEDQQDDAFETFLSAERHRALKPEILALKEELQSGILDRDALEATDAVKALRAKAPEDSELSIDALLSILLDTQAKKILIPEDLQDLRDDMEKESVIYDLFDNMLGNPHYDPEARARLEAAVKYDDVFFAAGPQGKNNAYAVFDSWQEGELRELGRLYGAGMDVQATRMLAYFGDGETPAGPKTLIERHEAYEFAALQYQLYGIQVLSRGKKVFPSEDYGDKEKVAAFLEENKALIDALPQALLGNYKDPETGETILFAPFIQDVKYAYLGMTSRPSITDPGVKSTMRATGRDISPGYIMSQASPDELNGILTAGAGRPTKENLRAAMMKYPQFADMKENKFNDSLDSIYATLLEIQSGNTDAFRNIETENQYVILDSIVKGLPDTLDQAPGFERIALNYYEGDTDNWAAHRRQQLGGELTQDQKMHMFFANHRYRLAHEFGDDFDKETFERFFKNGDFRRVNTDLTYEEAIKGMTPDQIRILDENIAAYSPATAFDYIEMFRVSYNDARANGFLPQQKEVTIEAEVTRTVEEAASDETAKSELQETFTKAKEDTGETPETKPEETPDHSKELEATRDEITGQKPPLERDGLPTNLPNRPR